MQYLLMAALIVKLKVIQILTRLVKKKECLIIATIHQPRPDIFEAFGRVLLLSDGNVFMKVHLQICKTIWNLYLARLAHIM